MKCSSPEALSIFLPPPSDRVLGESVHLWIHGAVSLRAVNKIMADFFQKIRNMKWDT